jgi:uncharacterized protein (TIGR02594 family)
MAYELPPTSQRPAQAILPARSIALLLATFSLLALSVPAFATPSGDVQPNHAEINRAAQLRHAREIRGAVRIKARIAMPVRRPAANALLARAGVGEQRPLLGWPALVTEARKYIGTNPTARSRLWCATFLNLVLAKTGYAGTGSDAAKSFASYGRRINEPKVGAIAVLARGKRGGHVGIVTGIDPAGNPIIISGNHGHRVGEGIYPRSRVLAYVMPTGRAPVTQLARASAATPVRSDADGEGGLTSPITELLAAINAEKAHTERGPDPFEVFAGRLPERRSGRVAPRVADRSLQQARAAAPPDIRPVPYRTVQQTPSPEPEPRVRVATAFHVSVERPATASTPIPRPRAAVPLAPLPRNRPVAQ